MLKKITLPDESIGKYGPCKVTITERRGLLNRLSAWLRRRSDGIVGFLTGIGVARGSWLMVGCLVAIEAFFIASSWFGWPERLGVWFKRRKAEKRECIAEEAYSLNMRRWRYDLIFRALTMEDEERGRAMCIDYARRASGLPDWEPK